MDKDLAEQVAEIAQRVMASGAISASGHGNVSVRVPGAEEMYFTAGPSLRGHPASAVVRVGLDGTLLEGDLPPIQGAVVAMHTAMYEDHPDVGCVLHTHSPYATAYAVAQRPIGCWIEAMAMFGLAEGVPVAGYGPRGSAEAVANIRRAVTPGVPAVHAGQLAVSPETVRELVADQFPQWRGLAIRAVDAPGTVNAIFRIGRQFAARFPLQPRDVESVRIQLESEARAARELAGRTRFATPEPVALGEPGAGYPLPWSVQTWLPGVTAVDHDPGQSAAFAHDLAEFIRGVRAIDTRGRTFSGQGRGGNLQSHDTWMETCFGHSGQLLDVPRLRRMWKSMRGLPRGAGGDLMSHGDLIPGNVLVAGGRLAGILDVGGLGPADPALDLVAAWHLLEAGPRQVLRDDLGCDDLGWERGKAWAFEQAMGLVWYYADSNPAMSTMGRRTLERIQADTLPACAG